MYFEVVGEIVRPSRNATSAARRSCLSFSSSQRALEPVQLGGVVNEDPAANGFVGRPLEQEVEQGGVVREGVLGRGRMRPVAPPEHALRRRLHQRLRESADVLVARRAALRYLLRRGEL